MIRFQQPTDSSIQYNLLVRSVYEGAADFIGLATEFAILRYGEDMDDRPVDLGYGIVKAGYTVRQAVN